MTEEVEVVVAEKVQNEPTELNDVEQKALELGWKPKEEWTGDPVAWRSPELFVALDPFYKGIDSLKRENKQLREANTRTAQMFSKVQETEYKRALEALKSEKKVALEEGNADRLIAIDEQISDVKAAQKTATEIAQRAVIAEPPQEFVDWSNRNGWYGKESAMRTWADARGVQLHQEGFSPSKVLDMVEKEAKEEFPHKFSNPNRERASSVEGSASTRTNTKGSPSINKLSDEERRIMKTIVADGSLTEKEYLEQYLAIR